MQQAWIPEVGAASPRTHRACRDTTPAERHCPRLPNGKALGEQWLSTQKTTLKVLQQERRLRARQPMRRFQIVQMAALAIAASCLPIATSASLSLGVTTHSEWTQERLLKTLRETPLLNAQKEAQGASQFTMHAAQPAESTIDRTAEIELGPTPSPLPK